MTPLSFYSLLSKRQGFSLLLLTAFTLISPVATSAEKPIKPVSEVTVLGINLLSSDLNAVRTQLWNIGGFLQAKTSVKQGNYDKFFPWSRARDSYYVLFNYNALGKITSVKRLYRPLSIEHSNRRSFLKTKDVALQIIKQIGQPTFVQRKGWGGTQRYPAYTWQDEKMTVIVDREGSEKLGNIFIRYIVKEHDPYEQEKEV